MLNARPLTEVSRNTLVVPRHLWQPHMRHLGIYRNVEYEIENLYLDGIEIQSTIHLTPAARNRVIATVRPLHRLHPRHERNWPVSVPLSRARMWSYKADVLCCALVTSLLAASMLFAVSFGTTFLGLYVIPTTSMQPVLRVGDALLVEKVSVREKAPKRGEIILFTPPPRLRRIASRGTRTQHRNDLFVKRVVATEGDDIQICDRGVLVNGAIVDVKAPGSPDVKSYVVPTGFVFVIGDNAESSLDSRYWGLLPVHDVVGRPLARLFPISRFDLHL